MPMKHKRFAALILTNSRPDRVLTYATLRKQGYTGPIYIIIDNEDKAAPRYHELFGDQVIVFDKAAVAQTFDRADNFDNNRTVVFARNACWEIARALGLTHYLQLDDDYSEFYSRFTPAQNVTNRTLRYRDLDAVFDLMLDFLDGTEFLTVAFGQGGDLIGGIESSNLRDIWMKRKAMNTFFCRTDRPFPFFGRLNEDINTYVILGYRGYLLGTIFTCLIKQPEPEQQGGGMTAIYKAEGTYSQSFYPVMYCPSGVRVGVMGNKYKRLHAAIDWRKVAPKILAESWRRSW